MEPTPSEEVIRQVRAEFGPRTLLSFSCGKDAIASWVAIRDHFDEVVPYHLYLVPGLEFVEEALAYYEGVFGCRIIRLPHPTLYRWLNGGLFQTPGRAKVIEAARLDNHSYIDCHDWACKEAGLPLTVLSATGVRAADSPMRRMAMVRHGAINRRKKLFYPIWDWRKDRLVDAIERSGIRLPVDYEMFGRSFDGLDLRFLAPLKRHRPADYRRVLEWFPLAEMEIYRHERSLQ